MCVVALKSMTYAIKAQRALNEVLITSEIIRLEPHMTSKGCAYGLKFNCLNLNLIHDIFRKKSIKYSEIIRL